MPAARTPSLARSSIEFCRRRCPQTWCMRTTTCWCSKTSIPRCGPASMAVGGGAQELLVCRGHGCAGDTGVQETRVCRRQLPMRHCRAVGAVLRRSAASPLLNLPPSLPPSLPLCDTCLFYPVAGAHPLSSHPEKARKSDAASSGDRGAPPRPRHFARDCCEVLRRGGMKGGADRGAGGGEGGRGGEGRGGCALARV